MVRSSLHIGMWPTRREIENGEAAAAQADVGAVGKLAVPEAGVVGAAMRLDVRHPRQRFPISAIHHAADAAHLA